MEDINTFEVGIKKMDTILINCQIGTLSAIKGMLIPMLNENHETSYGIGVTDGIQKSINKINFHIDALKAQL